VSRCDVTVVGAGPYGLSAAAHLRTIKGLEMRVFGEAMSFWSENMPKGMFLRSNWTATQIACPDGDLTLEAFQNERKVSFGLPVPIEQFIRYGIWYQSRAVPELERRRISRIERAERGFRLHTQDGETFESRRVVVAGGIGSFARRPEEFRKLPDVLVTHTNEHCDLSGFSGKRVLVVGCGQSALESAALLHEAGAQVEVVARSRRIHWLQGWASTTLHHRMGKLTRKILYAPTDVGPAGLSQLLARPYLVRLLPRGAQDRLRKRATRPAGARWLVNRLRDVPITLSCPVTAANSRGQEVTVRLADGRQKTVDHVLLGTGFHIDVSKYDFLAPELLGQMKRVNGFPILKDGLETSIAGLHILGAPGVHCFGPLLQFVSGTHFASKLLLRSVLKSTHSR
jgi:FAD-dependent urate hydroxylase